MGDPRIPNDRTDPMQQVAAPTVAEPTPLPPPGAMPAGAPDLGAAGPDGGIGALLGGGGAEGLGEPALAGLGGGLPTDPAAASGGLSSDQLTGDQLAALSSPLEGVLSPEEQEVEQLDAALNDPNTPPEQRQMIEQMMALAARRRLMGGESPVGGLGV